MKHIEITCWEMKDRRNRKQGMHRRRYYVMQLAHWFIELPPAETHTWLWGCFHMLFKVAWVLWCTACVHLCAWRTNRQRTKCNSGRSVTVCVWFSVFMLCCVNNRWLKVHFYWCPMYDPTVCSNVNLGQYVCTDKTAKIVEWPGISVIFGIKV